MSCRDEFVTNENGVGEDRILCAMRLERIAEMWEDRCTEKYNKRVIEYNRRVDELNKEADQARDFNERYAIPWVKEVHALALELYGLIKKWEAGENITPAAWDAVTAGRERKAVQAVHDMYPKDDWPHPVRGRFPNMIALFMYDREEQIQGYYEKQYAAVVEHVTNGSTVNTGSKLLQAYYKAQYCKIVKHFAEQGAITTELKRLAGDTSDGVSWQTPITAEQIERLHEQLKADQARLEEDVDDMLFYRLQYEDVISQDFDSHVWVRKVFEERNLSKTDQAVQHAAQKVQEWIAGWQSYSKGDADKCSAYRATPGFCQMRSSHTPYDRADVDGGREPDFVVDITYSSNISHEDALCLSHEPDFDRIGMALDNNINYADELFLPFEPTLDQFGIDLDNDTYEGDFFLPFDI